MVHMDHYTHDDVCCRDFFAVAGRNHRFNTADDDVTYTSRPAVRSAQHFDALQFLGARVVGDGQACLHLDHD